MPEFEMPQSAGRTFAQLDSTLRGYIEAAFFTECHCDNPDLESATFDDLAPETLANMASDCARFESMIENAPWPEEFDLDYEKLGRDLWFTRNGHGVGFWESDRWPEAAGAVCTAAAKALGTSDLYRGDDGRVYVS